MKKILLLMAAGCIWAATMISVGTAIFSSDAEFALRITGISTSLVIGSIGLFFVGWVFPKEE